MAVEVDVWSVDLDEDAPPTSAVLHLLTAEERTRAAGMAAGRRREFVLCRAVVRRLLAGRAGVPTSAVRWGTGRDGKPGPAGGVHWNLTHAGGRALVATCASAPVGVDLLRADAAGGTAGVVRRFGTAAERSALQAAPEGDRQAVAAQLLARREACVKALGGRLLDLLDLDVPGPGEPCSAGRVLTTADVPVAPGWAAAVAAAAAGPVTARQHRWCWRAPTGAPGHAASGVGP
ncbi:4'-phosphopantetheinyl transferase superfamily protein [Cellulomonas sp. JZ18]|uniref:4'-phosphopantetheinyl transferase family protein n=1 Tax=Cellulomonas sp. JZ18 TaxID=2654191 RepID=UPI0012D3BD4B|nr:4'-phosphopantetheinyl transferase superfamily protein [Cellulomonas sp. JZ18]QGQ18365.1 4'-phosphopantetheinyl transferase superfamily protein [Cellulomonas sp. JZ18]